ncbi:MAG: macro domain-containing protein [Gemmatimonadetes bacterium]|nr:macro domain-containing protein [Gemmatimonadota bacterium]
MVVDNLAFVDVDAVVRPATDVLEPTTSALRHFDEIGGTRFKEQLQLRDPLAIGAAVVTDAGELASKFVIHAIIRSGSEQVSADGVRRALVSTLQRAAAWQFGAVALPPVGTGPGNLPIEQAAQLMCEVVQAHTRQEAFPSEIRIVVETEDEKTMFEHLLKTAVQ